MIKRFSTFIFAFIAVLCAMGQTGMPYDYQEVAFGKCADGSNLKCRYIPADGKLRTFTITSEMPYLIIFDDGGARVLDKTTLRKIADLKLGSKEFVQINNDGYIMCSDNVAFFSREGQPPSTTSRAIRCGRVSMGRPLRTDMRTSSFVKRNGENI